jgi:hypothetical protein
MNIVNPLDGFRISRRGSPLKRAWPLLMVSPIGSSLKTQNVQHDRRVVRSIPARTVSPDGGGRMRQQPFDRAAHRHVARVG